MRCATHACRVVLQAPRTRWRPAVALDLALLARLTAHRERPLALVGCARLAAVVGLVVAGAVVGAPVVVAILRRVVGELCGAVGAGRLLLGCTGVHGVHDATVDVQQCAKVRQREHRTAAPPAALNPYPRRPPARPHWLRVGDLLAFGAMPWCFNICFGPVHIPVASPRRSPPLCHDRTLVQSSHVAARWAEATSSEMPMTLRLLALN